MAQANTEKQVGSRGTPHVGHADSVMNDERGSRSDIFDWSSSNPITRVIKVTLPTPLFLYIIIHSFHTSEASHMQLNASQRSVLRHEAAVASFNMSNDPPGFEGRPMKGSRPPRVK